ncbi:unnamed protein product [Meganyctiphanes norvegica]|uniref:BMP and activin membrane-bound inhibitor N-terminal domain-containing protein n=1 Tax=Meganyctiphanes norvegica TaxID=48144 RepID=A0AAV2R2D6_MEGNR
MKNFLFVSGSLWVHLLTLLLLQLMLLPKRSSQERLLTCVCTTPLCQALGESTCTTASKCYSQLLDRQDGTVPITRGCMRAGQLDSLLCMNQRPAVGRIANWPSLICCSHHLCNQDIAPTASMPPTTTDENNNELALLGLTSMEEFHIKYNSGNATDEAQKGLQHLYLMVIGISLLIMIIVSSVGFYVLYNYRSKYKTVVQNNKVNKSLNVAAAPLLSGVNRATHSAHLQDYSTRPKYLNIMIQKQSTTTDR